VFLFGGQLLEPCLKGKTLAAAFAFSAAACSSGSSITVIKKFPVLLSYKTGLTPVEGFCQVENSSTRAAAFGTGVDSDG